MKNKKKLTPELNLNPNLNFPSGWQLSLWLSLWLIWARGVECIKDLKDL